MADKEYVYSVGNFSLTSTWERVRTGTSQGESITTRNLIGASVTKSFAITGISLASGERVKNVILSATLSKSGTTDGSERITANGMSLSSGSRKLDTDSLVLNSNYDVTFYFRASGNTPAVPSAWGTTTYECTLNCTNVTLTVVTGTGSVFDGKVESLNEGDKIIVDESSAKAAYTLVHHNYNDGKALIFRDTSYGNSKYRTSASYNGYNGSSLDQYLTGTFYASLPSTTTQFLQALDYPIKETAYNSAAEITVNRMAATISCLETGQGGTVGYGSILNYTDTVGIGVAYWTREPVSGMNGYAKYVGANNTVGNQALTNTYAVRPTLGVLEEQLVRYSDNDGGYIFCTKCTAPSTIYINGVASNVSELNKEANLTLSWSAGTAGYNAPISGYAVWYSTSANGTYELYGMTTETSMTIIGPDKLRQTYYFKVQTLAPDDADYCNSDLSSTYRSAATKEGNVSYYDGTKWILTAVKYYNGSAWVDVQDVKYYSGGTWT